MFALVSSEELEKMGQIMVKQLKNRYNDISTYKRFVLGVDRSKMRLMDADENQQNLVKDTPAFDASKSGERVDSEKFKEWKIQ